MKQRLRGQLGWVPRWAWLTGGLSIAAGLALFLWGWSTGNDGTWAANPYLTNIVSALTGALVGIPITGIVLALLLDGARQARVKHEVHTGVRDALKKIDELAIDILGIDLRGPNREARLPERLCTVQVIDRYIQRLYELNAHRLGSDEEAACSKIKQHALDVPDWKAKVAGVRAHWRQVLELQAIAEVSAIAWLSAEIVARVDRAVETLDEVDEVYGEDGSGPDPATLHLPTAVLRASRAKYLHETTRSLLTNADEAWKMTSSASTPAPGW